MATIVTAHFDRSNGTRVEFTGTLISEYTARDGVIKMVSVDTPNGVMHAQMKNATMQEVEEPAERDEATGIAVGDTVKFYNTSYVHRITALPNSKRKSFQAERIEDGKVTVPVVWITRREMKRVVR